MFLIIATVASIFGILFGKCCTGILNFFNQLRRDDYILLQDGEKYDLNEIREASMPYEEFSIDDEKPTGIYWLFQCFRTATCIILSGLFAVLLGCLFSPSLNPCPSNIILGKEVQISRLVYDCVTSQIMQLSLPIYLTFLLSWKTFLALNILRHHVVVACFDTLYRVCLFGTGSYPCKEQHCYVLFIFGYVNNFISCWIVICKYRDRFAKRLKLFLSLILQQMFVALIISLVNKFIAPLCFELNEHKHYILIGVIMVPSFVCRTICRLISQRTTDFVPPSKLYLLSAFIDIVTKTEYRFYQANIKDTTGYILLSFAQSVIGFVERVSSLLVNYFLMWMTKRCAKIEISHHITPATRRLTADILLIGFLGEIVSTVVTLTFIEIIILIYRLPYLVPGSTTFFKDNIIEYLQRVGAGLAIEFTFAVSAIYILTRQMNLPLISLWNYTWKEKTMFAFFAVGFCIVYVGHEFGYIAAKQMTTALNNNNNNSTYYALLDCKVSYYTFW